jgi:hypothetical protein
MMLPPISSTGNPERLRGIDNSYKQPLNRGRGYWEDVPLNPLTIPSGAPGSGGVVFTREGMKTRGGDVVPITEEQRRRSPIMGGGAGQANPYGFTRDPNAAGFQVITEWYNPVTGETWTAPDSGWIPPSKDWQPRNRPGMGGGGQVVTQPGMRDNPMVFPQIKSRV